MKVEKKQTPLTVEDLIALMKADTLYAEQEFTKATGRKFSAIRALLDLAVAQRQMERVVHRKRHQYRLPSTSPRSEQPTLRKQSELVGWETQWRQFRSMCEATR